MTTTTATTTTTTITTITTTRITTNENNNKKNKITTPDLFNNHKSPAKAPAFDRTKVPTVDQAETGVALGVWIIIWQQNSDQLIDKKSGKDTAHGYAPSPAGPNHRSVTSYTMEAGAGMGTNKNGGCDLAVVRVVFWSSLQWIGTLVLVTINKWSPGLVTAGEMGNGNLSSKHESFEFRCPMTMVLNLRWVEV